MEKFEKSEIHSVNTRDTHDLHAPGNKVTSYQNGLYFAGTKLCNALPVNIKMLNFDMKTFNLAFCQFCRISLRLMARK
jgi:hypothetical protein